MSPIPTVRATRYITPMREGGSLPGLMESDDLGTYVVKYTGAGQGTPPLVAEIVVGELGRHLGVPVPQMVFVDLDEDIGRREPDPEIQHLLRNSAGINLGIDFLPRSIAYTGWRNTLDPTTAQAILWLDGLTVNVDRSWRNPNLLIWHGDLWAIDHGAALLFQHTWPDVDVFAARPYPLDDHVLADHADGMRATDAVLAPKVTADVLRAVLELVPDEWLPDVPGLARPNDVRARYAEYLFTRAQSSQQWLPKVPA